MARKKKGGGGGIMGRMFRKSTGILIGNGKSKGKKRKKGKL